MGTLISILIVLICIVLTLVVLVQDSKGGGLSSSFAGSNQVMGVRKTTDFLEKTTWTLAIALLVLSLFASNFTGKTTSVIDQTPTTSLTKKKAEEQAPPVPPAGFQNSNNIAAPTATAPAKGKPKKK